MERINELHFGTYSELKTHKELADDTELHFNRISSWVKKACAILLAPLAIGCVAEPSSNDDVALRDPDGPQDTAGGDSESPCFVPREYEISSPPFRFVENSGVDHENDYPAISNLNNGPGVCVGDLNNDGDADLAFAQNPSLVLYEGSGDFRFSKANSLDGPDRSTGCLIYDFDGDGDRDILATGIGIRLFRNRGGFNFSDETEETGLGKYQAAVSWSASAGDIDNDFDLDLAVFNYVPVGFEPSRGEPPGHRNYLFVYDGKRYSEEGRERGFYVEDDPEMLRDAPTYAGLMIDHNRDGFIDIHEGNDSRAPQRDRVFINTGDGHFEDRAREMGLRRIVDDMGIAVEDFDNNGVLDLLATDYRNFPTIRAFSCEMAEGNVSCEEKTDELGFDRHEDKIGWGVKGEDFDLDGDLDVFAATGGVVITGDISPPETENLFFLNRGNDGFEWYNHRSTEALAEERFSTGLATGDLDNDGDSDVAIANKDVTPTLLQNRAAAGNFLKVRLSCDSPNPDCIGARVKVTPEDGCPLERHVVLGGSFAGNSLGDVIFGLGESREADVEIIFPDQKRMVFEDIKAGQTFELAMNE